MKLNSSSVRDFNLDDQLSRDNAMVEISGHSQDSKGIRKAFVSQVLQAGTCFSDISESFDTHSSDREIHHLSVRIPKSQW